MVICFPFSGFCVGKQDRVRGCLGVGGWGCRDGVVGVGLSGWGRGFLWGLG